MKVNNMKNPNRKRNEFEAPLQRDVQSVGVKVWTERRGRDRDSTCPLVWCVPESISMYGGF
jgi:hypothetical protein